jgi:hypothetical protein
MFIIVLDRLSSEERKFRAQIRSDHPFPIGQRLVYFEVTIHNVEANGYAMFLLWLSAQFF